MSSFAAPSFPLAVPAYLGRRAVLAVVLGGWLGGTTIASAMPLPALIAQAKRSVVVVGSYGLMDNPRFGFRATGFVVGEGLHVITNAHVVPPEEPGRIDRSIAVQVWQDGSWRMRSARLLGRDLRNDLALLEIDGPAVPALKLSTGRDAPEGTSIALMGFPIGQTLGWAHVTHRGIVSAWTGIATPASDPAGLNPRAVRQLREGSFRIMQLDAIAYPGNSGGPVLDVETGEVIGVVQGGTVKGTKEAALSAPTGITFAVPADAAAALLAEYKR